MKYDVIVVGGGHAGSEAAFASAKMGANTTLISTSINSIAMTPCNPSIGGPAKGIVVREIDALGGIMGIASDNSMIQIKMMNLSKGPAVHSLRAQVDKEKYPKFIQKTLTNTKNLEIIEDMVDSLIFNDDNSICEGVLLSSGKFIYAKKVIITTGTYMDSYIINGKKRISSGPEGIKTNRTLSDSLKSANVELFKLKTGTPARVLNTSVDFSKAQVVPGDSIPRAFSFYQPNYLKEGESIDCYLIHTSKEVHDLINTNIGKSAMYSGVIDGVGPRYCPSIEDKLVRFPDKDRHQLFLEPETRDGKSIYVQGFSTSMPYDIQDQMINLLPGLENAEILKYGYAIEYDAIKPEQLKQTLELKNIKNLYSAGQINGTSGYEEAAGQGIVAGINAVLSIKGEKPLILDRTNSYIGLMIDDLITKGTEEPYRLLTSRSEFRLYLRNDNADQRLSKFGYDVGLLEKQYYDVFLEKQRQIKEVKEKLSEFMITPKNVTLEMANKWGTNPVEHGIVAITFLKRPDITLLKLSEIIELNYSRDILETVEVEIKYDGYIEKVNRQIAQQGKLYKQFIPKDIDYDNVMNLALEAREKLNKIRPETIGHATQISGINPADISVFQIYLEQLRRKNDN